MGQMKYVATEKTANDGTDGVISQGGLMRRTG